MRHALSPYTFAAAKIKLSSRRRPGPTGQPIERRKNGSRLSPTDQVRGLKAHGMTVLEDGPDAADRTPAVFRDQSTQAARVARWGASGGVGHRQCRGMG